MTSLLPLTIAMKTEEYGPGHGRTVHEGGIRPRRNKRRTRATKFTRGRGPYDAVSYQMKGKEPSFCYRRHEGNPRRTESSTLTERRVQGVRK